MPKILFIDLESTNLDGDFGYVLCVGYAWNDQKVKIASKDDFPQKKVADDKGLMRFIYDEVCKADIVVTWFGKGFDWKMMETRMLLAGCPPLPPMGPRHIDLWFTAKFNFKLHSNRLDSVIKWLTEVGCPYEKSDILPTLWVDAMCGDKKAMKYVKDHCHRDVEALRWVYGKLRPYIRQHPVVAHRNSCHVCGSRQLQFRGWAIRTSSQKRKQRRIQCQNCGAWGLRLPEKGDADYELSTH